MIFAYFAKNFNKPCTNFFAFGRKTLFIGNFQKIFEIFQNFIKKIAKNALFVHIFLKVNKP